MKRYFILGGLCLASVVAVSAPVAAQKAVEPTSTEPLVRTLIDRDSLRSIEIVTDRRESISQFFARQKLMVASSPTLDGRPVTNPAQWRGSKTKLLFVSYPLFNDSDFRMDLFGAYLELSPLTPALLDLLGSKMIAAPQRSLLILVPDEKRAGQKWPAARIVGRIQVLGAWSPDKEIETLRFVPSTSSKQSG